MQSPLTGSTGRLGGSALTLVPALLAAALSAGGCILQRPQPNPLCRADLPAGAESGLLVLAHGYKAGGLRAVWKEAGHVFLLSEQTRLGSGGPGGVTPFGEQPSDELTVVQDVEPYDYHQLWHKVNNHNLWILPPEIGILDSNPVYATFGYDDVLLWYNEGGQNWLHTGQLAYSANSEIIRADIVRMYQQGLEYIDRFFRNRAGDPATRVWIIREPDKAPRYLTLDAEGEPAVLAELKCGKPERRAAAAVVVAEMSGAGSRAALDALFEALDAPEINTRVQAYMFDAVARFWAVGNLDTVIERKIGRMANREIAERLRRYLVDRIPGSGLILGARDER
jgi:hypothetical protein